MISLNVFWSDILRYLAVGQAFLIIMLICVVIARYTFKLSITKVRDTALPWHIVLIGLSYIGLATFVLMEVRDRFGQVLTWRTPMTLIVFGLGDAALIFMMMHLSVQRIIVAALVEKMATKLQDDLDELRQTTMLAARKAEVAASKAEIAAETVQSTHTVVTELKDKWEDGNHG